MKKSPALVLQKLRKAQDLIRTHFSDEHAMAAYPGAKDRHPSVYFTGEKWFCAECARELEISSPSVQEAYAKMVLTPGIPLGKIEPVCIPEKSTLRGQPPPTV